MNPTPGQPRWSWTGSSTSFASPRVVEAVDRPLREDVGGVGARQAERQADDAGELGAEEIGLEIVGGPAHGPGSGGGAACRPNRRPASQVAASRNGSDSQNPSRKNGWRKHAQAGVEQDGRRPVGHAPAVARGGGAAGRGRGAESWTLAMPGHKGRTLARCRGNLAARDHLEPLPRPRRVARPRTGPPRSWGVPWRTAPTCT